MDNSIVLASHDICTGCSACEDACPKGCITMQSRGSLHSYPFIDEEACVKCGLCVRTCPAINLSEEREVVQKYYSAWHIDDNARLSSTSGGAGWALVESAIDDGWYVCGAAMDNHFILKHIITNNKIVAEQLKGSKYLQSDMKGDYKEIKKLLLQGKKLLYIGTPCQVEGVLHYVPKDAQKNLLTCGIICHGVNSPKVWKDYKDWLEKTQKSPLLDYKFRSKTHGWQKKEGGPNLRVSYQFSNGVSVDQPAWKNLFHWWFGHHYILRPSCLNCNYRREQRNSDIAIGDFWDVNKISSGVDTFKGVSAVITSSSKGDSFVKNCKNLFINELEAAASKRVLKGFIENQLLDYRLNQIEEEKKFELEYIEKGFDAMRKGYPAQNYFSRILFVAKAKLGIKR